MGAALSISHSTAKWLAPLSLVVNASVQQYGMAISKPNMLEVHYRNIYGWSPYPWFIVAFFTPQQLLQIVWLYKLVRSGKQTGVNKIDQGGFDLRQAVDYAPYYTIGNFAIAAWLFFWNSERFNGSMALVTLNSFSQLFYIFTRLGPNNSSNRLTYLNATTFAGVGVLDLLHNGCITFGVPSPPSQLIQGLTGLGFFSLAALSNNGPLGACLVYDLVGLAVGQWNAGSWGQLLAGYAVGTAAIVGYKNFA